MAGPHEKSIMILGPVGSGKSTITGCMLFKYGGIDLRVMQRLEASGIGSSGRKYTAAAEDLQRNGDAIQCYTPRGCRVVIVDSEAAQVDCAIVLVPADSENVAVDQLANFEAATKVIIVINKI